MSNTPKLPDECKKLLDNGHCIVLYTNAIGSYTAATLTQDQVDELYLGELTDDFEPSQALYRLTEKVFGNIA